MSRLGITQEEFLKKCIIKHANKYDYSKTVYKKSNEKIEIICKEHGSFWQLAGMHAYKHGCPTCSLTKHKEAADLTGQRFGKLLVSSRAENIVYGEQNKVAWNCICECENKCTVSSGNLIKGQISCGCSHNRQGQDHPSWKGYENISGKYLASIKRGALSRGLEYDITPEYMWTLFTGTCALSGLSIVFSQNSRNGEQTASLDRIDSDRGYVVGNVQWVHKDVNLMKNNFSNDYFLNMCSKISKQQNKKALLFL
jgi:hypothetical protein